MSGSRGAFPGLGKDPTPGDREAVAERLEATARALQQADEAASRLKQALDVSANWKGKAADGFGAEGDDALLGLEAGKSSLAPVGQALETWLVKMTANQQAADILEQEAMRLKNLLNANPSKADKGRHTMDLAQVFGQADRLEAKHKREANDAADAIEGAAADKAFVPVKTSDGIELLQSISTLSGEVAKWSATLGTVAAVVPGGQIATGPLYTIAAGAQGVKTLSDTSLILTGSPKAPKVYNVVFDTVGGFAPTRWGKSAVQGARAAKAAREARKRNPLHTPDPKPAPTPKSLSERRRDAAAAIAGMPADGLDTYEKVTGRDLPGPFDGAKTIKPYVDVVAHQDADSVVRATDEGAKFVKGKVEKKGD